MTETNKQLIRTYEDLKYYLKTDLKAGLKVNLPDILRNDLKVVMKDDSINLKDDSVNLKKDLQDDFINFRDK